MDLMHLLPEYYRGNKTMEELQGIFSTDITELAAHFNDTIDQCFVSTTTALLSRYEEIYGLTADVTKTDESRRERLRAKIRGVGTVTKQMIIDTAAVFSGGEVEVIENPEESRFIIKFVGSLGIPANMSDLTLTIEEIKPAHLSYTFEYTYRTWAEVSGSLWGDKSAKTWYQLATE